MTQQNDQLKLQRRDLLKTVGGGIVGASLLPVAAGSDHDDGDDILLADDFESYSTGSVPSLITTAGSSDQGVVGSTAFSGDQSYRMSGFPGGCWEAIARRPLDVQDGMVITGAYRLGDGQEGCHSGSGTIKLGTTTGSSWTSGSNVQLLGFYPDGTIQSAGTQVGEFEPGDWVEFEVAYQRDRENSEVTQIARIADQGAVEVTRDVRDFEDDLSALELDSDDFTVFWDDLSVERADLDFGDSVGLTLAPESTEASTNAQTSYDILALNAANGVSAYSISISVSNPEIAHIEDFEYNQEPDFGNTNISSDGSSITLEAGQGGNTYDADRQVVLGSIILQATERGETNLAIDSAELLDTEQAIYQVEEMTGGTLTVTTPPAVVGESRPQDLNGDGLFRDINGDGEFDIFDVQALYANLESDAVQNNPRAYNFSEAENPQEVGVFDVQALLSDLQEQEGSQTVADSLDIDGPPDGESLSLSDVEPELANY